MADNMISPGVYTSIQSLASYVNNVPGTIGFVPVITEKGKDNVLYRCTGTQDFLENFGEPDIRTFGKYYGCGPYIATQHLSVSNDLYVIRVLPDDAIYAHTYVYFAKLDDFPQAYKFVKMYQAAIMDPNQTAEITVYPIRSDIKDDPNFDLEAAKETVFDNGETDEDGNPVLTQTRFFDEGNKSNVTSKKTSAGTAAYTDAELLDTNVWDDVAWTNNPAYGVSFEGDLYQIADTYRTLASEALSDATCKCFKTDLTEATTADDVAYVTKTDYVRATTEASVDPDTGDTIPAVYTAAGTVTVDGDDVSYYAVARFSAAEDAITAGTGYKYNGELATKASEVAYTTDENLGVGSAISFKTDKKFIVFESYISSRDGNAGGWRLSSGFYNKKHAGLSAFSVKPGIEYPILSDVTCFKQYCAKDGALYTIKDSAKEDAFNRRLGFNADGYLVLNEEKIDTIIYTSHVELASDTQKVSVKGFIPGWYVDPEGWYLLDPNKVNDAIVDYDAYDENGFLTTNKDKAKYCGSPFNASKDVNGVSITEVTVALRTPVGTLPADQKIKDRIYVLDRTIGRDKIEMLCAKCEAFDKNGYPTMDWTKAVLTSNMGLISTNESTGEDEVSEWYAKTALTPKMSNTQLLDSLFYGNDTLIEGVLLDGKCADTVDVNAHEAVLCSVRAVGRGDYYNDYSIKISSDANPQNFGTYKFQVFELQDGADTMVESFNVSFDPTALDGDGESLYFVDVINKFSTRVVVEANPNAVALFKQNVEAFYKNDPTIADIATDYVCEDGTALVGGFPEYIPEFVNDEMRPTENGMVINGYLPTDTEGNEIPLGFKAKLMWEAYYDKAWAEKVTHDAAEEYAKALEAVSAGAKDADVQLGNAVDKMNLAQDMTATAAEIYNWAVAQNLMNLNDSDPLAAGEQTYYLQNGSLGSLIDKTGKVNDTVGKQILSFAYTGLLKNPVVVKKTDESTGSVQYVQQYTDNLLDTDWIYFSIVYDPGYKPDVKQAALDLVDTYRRDCVLLSDCGDNANYEECLKYVGYIKGAADAHMWNTYLAARYEPYSRIYDKFTGKDIWVSPIYHMAQMIPKNDALYNIWYASAGFNRGTVASIKELRYSPNKAQRDQMYMAQVNPIVHFPEGMTVWGQLTTQKKADPLSDLNSVRTVLYIKRALEQYCRGFIFEFNDAVTWSAITGACNSFLGQIQSAGGIEGYSVSVGATDYELKTKTCHVDVTLTMRKTLEKIKLNFFVQ